MPERDRRKQDGSFNFFAFSSSVILKVSSVWNAPPLNYFTFLFPPYLHTNPHCVVGCFLSYDSTASSSLTGSFILCATSLFFFLLLSPLFSLYYSLWDPSQCTFSEHPDRASPQNLLQTKTETSLLSHRNLKVDKTPFCFCNLCYICGCRRGSFISIDMGSNHVGFSWTYVAACDTCTSHYSIEVDPLYMAVRSLLMINILSYLLFQRALQQWNCNAVLKVWTETFVSVTRWKRSQRAGKFTKLLSSSSSSRQKSDCPHQHNQSDKFSCSYDSKPRGEPTGDQSWDPPHPSQDAVPVTSGFKESEEHPKRWRQRILHTKCFCALHRFCRRYWWVEKDFFSSSV